MENLNPDMFKNLFGSSDIPPLPEEVKKAAQTKLLKLLQSNEDLNPSLIHVLANILRGI